MDSYPEMTPEMHAQKKAELAGKVRVWADAMVARLEADEGADLEELPSFPLPPHLMHHLYGDRRPWEGAGKGMGKRGMGRKGCRMGKMRHKMAMHRGMGMGPHHGMHHMGMPPNCPPMHMMHHHRMMHPHPHKGMHPHMHGMIHTPHPHMAMGMCPPPHPHMPPHTCPEEAREEGCDNMMHLMHHGMGMPPHMGMGHGPHPHCPGMGPHPHCTGAHMCRGYHCLDREQVKREEEEEREREESSSSQDMA
ncbi:hypothetical protein KIPB_006962 [Kipferlia bialata]|uniref:Uncharacterized protein n=1 Tax=Kipferlia bialata TaxID=797122 RepID=A0A9K3GK71_9EUKA|nr:hypothetical protein KIPB_006962 [Kipferlia bialata]|eukprot:g6962.t1